MIKILGLIALVALALPQPFIAQDPVAQKPPGPIVELGLIVTDKDGKPVETIDKNEIRIIEDKVDQTVLSVDRDDRPIDYGLIIDSSASLKKLIAAAVEAAKLIIINRRGSDEIFIEQFSSTEYIVNLHDFTTDNNALLESLKLIKLVGGQSAVIDALYVGAEHVTLHNRTKEGRRKALVIITDGEDRLSYYKLEDLVKLLRQEGIQVFCLGLTIDLDKEGGFIRTSPRDRAEKLLKTLAYETGGRVFFPRTGAELIDATAEVITHLRSQFRVTYQSSHRGKKGFRKVDIQLITPSGEKRSVIVPRGYYVGPKEVQIKRREQKSQ